ncbi:hypothetical protein K440DRAFT_56302 [Wilcoxina mikolae CBS 423.85]|nr:hypothetical protein K440DRAFT_56302 [Wilcoxina mikolae CBS 423.85]
MLLLYRTPFKERDTLLEYSARCWLYRKVYTFVETATNKTVERKRVVPDAVPQPHRIEHTRMLHTQLHTSRFPVPMWCMCRRTKPGHNKAREKNGTLSLIGCPTSHQRGSTNCALPLRFVWSSRPLFARFIRYERQIPASAVILKSNMSQLKFIDQSKPHRSTIARGEIFHR